jgi:hypothetical protein
MNVAVSLNSDKVATFAAPDGWQNITVPLPAREYSGCGEIFTFDFDRTARPSDSNSHSNDNRGLALRVDRIWVDGAEAATVNASVRDVEHRVKGSSVDIAASSREALR